MPLERLLVETDAPYLAPEPHRGRPNEPAYVVQTATVLAETAGVSEQEIARATTDNFYRLFAKAAAADGVGAAMSLVVTILGCGSSGGVPRVGSGWGLCDPNEPRNRRRRCSILVERTGADGTTRVLVDASRTCASS